MSDSTDDERLFLLKMKKARKSESEIEENEDRLSDLPDSVLLHILSFVNAKVAVRTCLLSTRWKDLWKCLPSLQLLSSNFSTLKSFTKFVFRLLTLRDGSTALHGLDLRHIGSIQPQLIKRIVNYAVSHNVQQFGIYVNCDMQHLLPGIFTCHTLTSLKLIVIPKGYIGSRTFFPTSLNLPALTTLHLGYFTFCSSTNDRADPFSAFIKLNNLIIDRCSLRDARIFCISSATLVNLTLNKLETGICTIELSTPCLHRFACTGFPHQYLRGSGLSSVKEVNIDASLREYNPELPLILLSWLQDLVNMTSLSVTTNTIQVLFLVPGLLKTKLPSLANLKKLEIRREPLSPALKVIMIDMMAREIAATKCRKCAIRLNLEVLELRRTMYMPTAPLPDGTTDYFVQNLPPSAKFKIKDITSCEFGIQLFQEDSPAVE